MGLSVTLHDGGYVYEVYFDAICSIMTMAISIISFELCDVMLFGIMTTY